MRTSTKEQINNNNNDFLVRSSEIITIFLSFSFSRVKKVIFIAKNPAVMKKSQTGEMLKKISAILEKLTVKLVRKFLPHAVAASLYIKTLIDLRFPFLQNNTLR